MATSSNTETDFQCFTCNMVTRYHEQSGEFIEAISETMLTPMWILFLSVCGVWAVWEGIKLAANMTDFAKIIKDVFFLIIAASLLSSQSQGIIITIFDTTISIMGGAASAVLEKSIQESNVPAEFQGLARLAAVSENGMAKVMTVSAAMISSAGITNPAPILYAILLFIPYLIMMVIFFSHTVIAVFRVMVISAFAPFLIMCFGFGWGRNMTSSGLRTLLAAIIVLFSASLALGSIMYGMSSLDITKPGNDIAELDFANVDFFVAVALGWMGTAFMTEAVGIANSITGSALSNTSAGIMTAGIVGTAATIASKTPAGMIAGQAASAISDPTGFAAGKAAKVAQLRDTFDGYKNETSKGFSERFSDAYKKPN